MAENPKKSSMADRYPLLWIGLGVYVVISVFYQAVVFPNLPGGTEKHTFSTDCFQLGIRFPRVLTVATRPGEKYRNLLRSGFGSDPLRQILPSAKQKKKRLLQLAAMS